MGGGQLTSVETTGSRERRGNAERRSIRGAFRLIAKQEGLRRRTGRREEDLDRGYYTDRHDAPLLLIAMSVLLFAALDAILTLQLIAYGATELNPFMRILIDVDVYLFAWFKMALTAVVLIIAVSHANYRLFGMWRTRSVLLFALWVYVALVTYQLTLLSLVVKPLADVHIG